MSFNCNSRALYGHTSPSSSEQFATSHELAHQRRLKSEVPDELRLLAHELSRNA